MEEKKELTLGGLPWQHAIVAVILCAIPMYWGIQSSSLSGTLCSCFALAVVLYEFGERLPIWNNYIGGGLLMAFFGVALFKYFGLIPTEAIDNINRIISGDDVNLLEFYIIFLIVGSVLALEKDILLRSFAGYIPAILGGLVVSAILGVAAGLVFGVSPTETIMKYVLPIMGGGNGAGAVPLSNIYEQVTGDAAANFYGFAIIILTVGNIFAIVGSAMLNVVGQKFPKMTGDKRTLVRGGENLARDDKKVKYTINDMLGAMVIAFACYSVGRIMGKKILPTIAGASIHPYAYMIIFVVILAALGVIPANIRAGAKRLQSFMTSVLGMVIMVGMGADFDIAELFTVMTPGNVIMAFFIVVGAIIGAGGVGYLVGFYPVDSALTAGLCMANRGGSGDLACLGAADRMDLMAYAQLSSRLGGGIVLIIASFLFSFWL
ncbi:damage-inducible protein CinA [Lachnoclostridium sp. An14]|uniref:2-hydroxycarboxylate transporter family protein n=1 Tax=Lachnoclostridium sp. An14 TaxID=1965562 RepID=UPI000B381AD5|nr:2-hydroxycarboxylate transporter family protein [Lachnoclostridium sp. An14]OUQ21881.1 damage-inducible protein CinA [Lachnoclostridium sp. An14]